MAFKGKLNLLNIFSRPEKVHCQSTYFFFEIYCPYVNSLFSQLSQVADGLYSDVTRQVGFASCRVSALISQQLRQAGVGLNLGPRYKTQPTEIQSLSIFYLWDEEKLSIGEALLSIGEALLSIGEA